MDGTLYLGHQLYDFTIELLDTLKATGRKYLFMTNRLYKRTNAVFELTHFLQEDSNEIHVASR